MATKGIIETRWKQVLENDRFDRDTHDARVAEAEERSQRLLDEGTARAHAFAKQYAIDMAKWESSRKWRGTT